MRSLSAGYDNGGGLVWGGGRTWAATGVCSAASLLNVVLFLGLQTFAVMLLPSGTAAVVIYLQPILIGVLAWFVLGEPLSAGRCWVSCSASRA
jgi:drug/metabolite transporter (DMT)-like permease